MKISLNCKLDSKGAYGFIKPIADIEKVEQIMVFRDAPAVPDSKIKYYCPMIRKPLILCQLIKFFQMMFYVPSDTDMAIGIYEIPHGLLAFLLGKIKKIPVTICIIGNPGYTKVRKGIRKFLMYYMLKRIRCITVTGSNARAVLQANGVEPGRIHILPNSIDTKKFSPRLTNKKYDIISLAYLSPVKELVNLLRITDIIRKAIPEIKVAIGGKGPERENLERAIDRLALRDNVELTGYVEDTPEFNRSGRVFVLTSSSEGVPRTVIEAMACGIPSVVSGVGDVQDLVIDGSNGFVIKDYSDIDAFAEKILILLRDTELYSRFSKEGIQKVIKNYSPQAATNVWKNILGVNTED